MKKINLIVLAASTIIACGNKTSKAESLQDEQVQPSESAASLPPVETNAPVAGYKPAFEGQTRVRGVKTTTPFTVSVVTEALDSPWGIAPMPDGRLLITEKKGTMRIVSESGAVSPKITGLPKVDARGQGGLLGLCLDPDFRNNRMVYFVFSEAVKGGNLTSVAKGRLSDDEKRIESPKVIYRAIPAYDGTLHYGGRILFDKDGYLFVSTGERSDKVTRPQAQSLKSALGKIVRITTEGKPAPGNPFEGKANALPEIYTYGHRNVQGLSIHPETNVLWENEFGPKGGDEVNIIEPGKDYGWPTITYGIEYAGARIGDAITQQKGMEQPVYYWDPVVSPSGMTFYSGSAIPEWKNNLFIGGLSSRHLIRLVINKDKVAGEERLLVEQGDRIRDVAMGHDEALYAISDEGRLFRIGKP